ncbi:MAG TPA: hypothetical protein VIY29_02910 [Ktedonobacteraceae bacterium]
MKIALKITPQRSTQYANMTEILAAPELLASPLGTAITSIIPATLAGQSYLIVALDDASHPHLTLTSIMPTLSRLGATSEVYEYFDALGAVTGPLLRPLDPQFTPFVPLEMAEIRRYKGKTNEVFTRVLLNIAIFAGAYAGHYTERLRILDPLAGGATTLFLALAGGYDGFGVELERQDVDSSAIFIRQYLQSEHIPFKELDERGRRAGRRYQFEIGRKGATRILVLAHGDSCQANLHLQEVPGGPRVHAIVGDLPYGIQHFAEIAGMLQKTLPVWEHMLLPGGTLALAWNATRIERANMLALLEDHTQLAVRNDPPYTQFEHTVDRVIKKRDIVVAVKRS